MRGNEKMRRKVVDGETECFGNWRKFDDKDGFSYICIFSNKTVLS